MLRHLGKYKIIDVSVQCTPSNFRITHKDGASTLPLNVGKWATRRFIFQKHSSKPTPQEHQISENPSYLRQVNFKSYRFFAQINNRERML
jgi:hypothetical protein